MAITVTVPPACVDPLRRSVLTLYQAKAEALQHASLRYLAGDCTLGQILERTEGLARIDRLLDQLGRGLGPAAEAREITTPGDLLREAAYGALIDVAESAAELVHRSWQSQREPAELVPALEWAAELAALVAEVERLVDQV